MKKGDRFFTIAYTQNTRVIEVEVIDTEIINHIRYIHFQNIEDTIDKWFLPESYVNQWKYKSKEDAKEEFKKIYA